MSDVHDFEIDPGDLPLTAEPPAGSSTAPPQDPDPDSMSTPGSALAPVPPPLVVIQYRNRGLHMALLPPLLILLAALVITSYQRQARLRPLSPPPAAVSKADGPANPSGRRRIIMVEGSGTGAAVEPIQVRAATPPLPPPPTAPVAATEPAPTPATEPVAEQALARVEDPRLPGPFSPFDLEAGPGLPPLPAEGGREDAVGPLPEPPVPLMSAERGSLSPDSPEMASRGAGELAPEGQEPGPAAEPRVTKEQILQGIRAEAVQKKADQENLKNEMVHAKAREYYEVFRKIQAERPAFHNDLRRLLQELGDGAGQEIDALCDRYGRNTLPEVHDNVVLALNRSAARLKRRAKIEMMRSQGVPEPVILDFLAHEQDPYVNSRRGPRDHNEVFAFAARVLLAYPPVTSPAAKPARTPAATRSVVGVAAPPVPRTARPPQ